MSIDAIKTHIRELKHRPAESQQVMSHIETTATLSFLGYLINLMGKRLSDSIRKMREVENKW